MTETGRKLKIKNRSVGETSPPYTIILGLSWLGFE